MQNFPQNSIPAHHAEKLIAAHDGDVALLYVWLCRSKVFDSDKAAIELCRTEREISAAYEKLCRMELNEAVSAQSANVLKLQPADQLPEYTAKDIVSRSKSDPAFSAVIFEAQRCFGRDLSSSELKALFGIYDYLALPVDVIFLLLNHCVSTFAEKYGPGRLPSMRSIEKEAYSWVHNEILTAEQAEEYIQNSALLRSKTNDVKSVLNINGRALTATESKYIKSWLDMGFETDAIAVAYDRTVTNTGALKWSYMNKIMQSWHEKGIHSSEEIEEKDSRPKAPVKVSAQHRDNVSSDELERLRAIYNKVKNN